MKEIKELQSGNKDIGKDEKISIYSSLDACVCCRKYMPEGTGMVCDECMRKMEQENEKQ